MVYLVPLLWQQRQPTLAQAWLFLERNGTHLIELDAADPVAAAVSFLEENELEAAATPFQAGGLVFAPVVVSDPELTNFYTWRETPAGTTPMREVWRPFLWVADASGADIWGVNGMLKEIALSESESAYSVLEAYSQTLRPSTELS